MMLLFSGALKPEAGAERGGLESRRTCISSQLCARHPNTKVGWCVTVLILCGRAKEGSLTQQLGIDQLETHFAAVCAQRPGLREQNSHNQTVKISLGKKDRIFQIQIKEILVFKKNYARIDKSLSDTCFEFGELDWREVRTSPANVQVQTIICYYCTGS